MSKENLVSVSSEEMTKRRKIFETEFPLQNELRLKQWEDKVAMELKGVEERRNRPRPAPFSWSLKAEKAKQRKERWEKSFICKAWSFLTQAPEKPAQQQEVVTLGD